MKRFYDYNAVRQSLENSIIRYQTLPVFVFGVTLDEDTRSTATEEVNVHMESLACRDSKDSLKLLCSAEDPDLDISSPPLGYLNFDHEEGPTTYYLERVPVRRWKRGVCASNISCIDHYKGRVRMLGSWLHSVELGNTVCGIYPSFKGVYNEMVNLFDNTELDGGVYCKAFDRDLALGFIKEVSPLQMIYKARVIGDLNDNGQFKIKKQHQHYYELLCSKGLEQNLATN